jgi:hypothetical protein
MRSVSVPAQTMLRLGSNPSWRGGGNSGSSIEGSPAADFSRVKYESVSLFHEVMHGKQLAWSQYAEAENRARNAAKHMRPSTDETITCDLEDEALWMIVRACYNSDRLGLPRTQHMREFEDWFFEHVVGY